MNFKYGNRKRGFTIVELMIVLVILAIIVALAYPSYIDYVRKARRGEAEQLLMNWSVNQEIYRSNNPTYADAAELAPPQHDYYGFTVTPADPAGTYTLTATATGDQLNDKAKGDCTVLTLTSAGVKGPAVCWGGSGS